MNELKRMYYAEAQERVLLGIEDQEDRDFISKIENENRCKKFHIVALCLVMAAILIEGII